MKLRTLTAAFVVTMAGLTTAPAAMAAPSHAPVDRVTCTTTSSGSCIRGGQFCPKSKYGKAGWDAKGRRYVCKGSRTHPHWMK